MHGVKGKIASTTGCNITDSRWISKIVLHSNKNIKLSFSFAAHDGKKKQQGKVYRAGLKNIGAAPTRLPGQFCHNCRVIAVILTNKHNYYSDSACIIEKKSYLVTWQGRQHIK